MNNPELWDILVDSDTYRVFDPKGPSRTIEFVKMFSSNEPLLDSWEIPDLGLFKYEGEEKKPLADFMSGFDIMTISSNAMKILKKTVEKDVDFLPLRTEAGPYYALHVKVIDCLDKERSIVERARDESIIGVDKYAFDWDVLKNVNMFRVKELGLSRLLVSDIFKRTYEKNKLNGLIFYPVHLVE
jgi:hypothetical protein